MELLGNNVRVHLGLGTPQHPLPPRGQGIYNALARVPHASLSHCTGDHDTMGIQTIARRISNYGDGEYVQDGKK